MKNDEKIFLTADVINGVQAGNDESALTPRGLMDEEYFFDALREASKDWDQGKCIGAYVGRDTYEKIEKEYGISE